MLKTIVARGPTGRDPVIMPMQRIGAFAGVPDLIRQLGADPAHILASAGLARDALGSPENRLPLRAVVRLLDIAAERTQCPHFGLLAGRMWRLADLGLVGDIARHSRTAGEALATATVHQHLNSGGSLAFVMQRAGIVDFGYAIYDASVQGAAQFHDAVLAAYFHFMRELCGPDWLPSEVFVSHAKPLDSSQHRALFKVQPRFNAEFSALRFPARWMDRVVAGSDADQLRRALQQAATVASTDLVDQVLRALRILMLYGKNSGNDVATALSMHRRTLNRRLKAQNTTFQHVLDEVRFNVARQLLAESDIALDDIAATLGYAGVSPFMRTFRRWAGTTPARWRRASIAQRDARQAADAASASRVRAPRVLESEAA